MELKKSSVETASKEHKEEAKWLERDLDRRRALREALEAGEVNLLIGDIRSHNPRLTIKPTEGGSLPHFARAVSVETGCAIEDPENHRDLIGVENLDLETDFAKRLEMIAKQIPAFIESFHYTQKVPVKIYFNHADLRKKEPAATTTSGSGKVPHVEIDQAKLEPFYTNPKET